MLFLRPTLQILLFLCFLLLTGCAAQDDNPFKDRELNRQQNPDTGQNELQQGIFLDSRVINLRYKRSSNPLESTKTAGEFDYAPGERVDFYVGNIYLGGAQGASVITPAGLDNNNVPLSDEALTRRLQFLQALDGDNNLWNGITIDQDIHERASEAFIPADALDSMQLDTLLDQISAPGRVNAASALIHFNDTRRALFTGNYALDINVAESPDVLHLEFSVDPLGVIKGWAETRIRENEPFSSQNIELLPVNGSLSINGLAEIQISSKAYKITLEVDSTGNMKAKIGQDNEAGFATFAGKYAYHYFRSDVESYIAEYTGEGVRVYRSMDESISDFVINFNNVNLINAQHTYEGDFSATEFQLDKLGNASVGQYGENFTYLVRQPYHYAGIYLQEGWQITITENGLMQAFQENGQAVLPSGRVYANGKFEVRRSDYFSTSACDVPLKISGQIDILNGIVTFEQQDAPACE